MSLIPIDTKELPRDWRRVLALVWLLVLGGTIFYLGYLGMAQIARAQARDVAKEVVKEDLDKYKEGVSERAAQAAHDAVKDSIGPMWNALNALDKREAVHEGRDDDRQNVSDRRQDQTDQRLNKLENQRRDR